MQLRFGFGFFFFNGFEKSGFVPLCGTKKKSLRTKSYWFSEFLNKFIYELTSPETLSLAGVGAEIPFQGWVYLMIAEMQCTSFVDWDTDPE